MANNMQNATLYNMKNFTTDVEHAKTTDFIATPEGDPEQSDIPETMDIESYIRPSKEYKFIGNPVDWYGR